MPITAPSLLPVSASSESDPHVPPHVAVAGGAIVSHVFHLILGCVAVERKLPG